MIRDVLTHPSKTLRKRSRLLDGFEPQVADVVRDMVDSVRERDGSGLAAIQIGQPIRVVVLNCTGNRVVTLVNPRIVDAAGIIEARETCLSLPSRWVKVQRYARVVVEHLRQHGTELLKADDPELAVALQHEIDHLNGVLVVDREHTKLRPFNLLH